MSAKLERGEALSDAEKDRLENLETAEGGVENYALKVTDQIFEAMREGIYTPEQAQAKIKTIVTHLGKPLSGI